MFWSSSESLRRQINRFATPLESPVELPHLTMSIPLIVVAAFLLVLVGGLSFHLDRRFRVSLTSVEEKSAGFLFYYRSLLGSVFSADAGREHWLALIHYVALHILIPVGGLGFWLRTDGNFLVVIFSLLWSIQLLQRLYPGPTSDEWDDFEPEERD